uniref:tryptase-like n=1 Tax=Myxine glutinosa TaxID=7769 RepID=UPI00358E485D
MAQTDRHQHVNGIPEHKVADAGGAAACCCSRRMALITCFCISTLLLVVVLTVALVLTLGGPCKALECSDHGFLHKDGAPRITNGVQSTHKWPWQASLQVNNNHICGAVVIGNRWLLTARHCINVRWMQKLSVLLDTLNLDNQDAWRVGVSKVIQHPGENENNDLALLELQDPLDITSCSSRNVRPIALPLQWQRWNYSRCYITGWGSLHFLGPSQKSLNEGMVNIVKASECEMLGNDENELGKLCAGKPSEGVDSCQGDSGGPLVCEEREDHWVLIGLTSYGRGCGGSSHAVYTRVTSYIEWIRVQVQEDDFCDKGHSSQ